jgi:hypothetical protein
MPFSVITNKSNSESSASSKTGPTLASSVLGFTALSVLYPGGMNSFMYNAINKSLPAQLLRIGNIIFIQYFSCLIFFLKSPLPLFSV